MANDWLWIWDSPTVGRVCYHGVALMWDMKVGWLHFDVVGWLVVFGEVVCMIVVSGLPVYAELALFDSVLYPIEPHVHGFGLFNLGAAIGKPSGVELSVAILVGCCWGQPILVRI